MKKLSALDHKFLRLVLPPKQLDFVATDELEPLTKFVGQERALQAISFGIGIKSRGYHLYAMGPPGIGKRSLIRAVLEERARQTPVPADWCYIYNFAAPEKPIALSLPPGMGIQLQQDMKLLINDLSTSILTVFESDEYRRGMQEILDVFNAKRKKLGKKISEKSKNTKIPHLYKERHEHEKKLQLRLTSTVVEPLIIKLEKKYDQFPDIEKYLTAVQSDIINSVHEFLRRDENTELLFFVLDSPVLLRYQINLLVDNSQQKGAPVIFAEHPSYSNLICRVEHKPQMGAMVTHFTLIRPGALHQANGGYLMLEIRKIKHEPHAWEGLKRALYGQKILIEPVEHYTESTRTISLEPMPIPLEIKIILLGDRHTFYTLCQEDPDFNELFKVAVDFDEQIPRNKQNVKLYARLIGTIAGRDKLRPFHASAVAAIIDYSSRLAEDIEKLSMHIRSINDLIYESNYWAEVATKKVVDAQDVKQAIDHQTHRVDRARDLYYEDIYRNFILIHTTNKLIGQVNCLSVVRIGKFSYGHPTRVSAKVRMGKGKVIDIQREIKMAGPIHTKGGLILSNFLAGRYNQNHAFSLSASLAFEQMYSMIEGDSASVAELSALLSALADIPIKQSLAVTGSIDQYGEVQAIGGVNEKIEGFFDICNVRGLTGKQGVLIPAVNVKNLMLREDVCRAAAQKKFFIYPVHTIDEAITLLTGIAAGALDKNGQFPKNSVNDKVEKRLQQFSKNNHQ